MGSRTREHHLVMVRTTSSWSSISWRMPLFCPMPAMLICPDTKNTGRRRCIGVTQAGRGVQHAGARHDQGGAYLSSGAGVAVGHISGALLVASGDEPDPRFALQAFQGMIKLHTPAVRISPVTPSRARDLAKACPPVISATSKTPLGPGRTAELVVPKQARGLV